MKQIFTRLSLALAAFIFLGLFLSACGGNDEADPTSAPDVNNDTPTEEVVEAPTDVPAPTDTPEPEPTATTEPSPTPEPTPDPTAGFVSLESAEGGFKLMHPEGWFTSDLFGLAIIASSEELLDSPDPGEEGGVMVVIAGPTEDFDSDFGSRDPIDVVNNGFGDLGFGEDAEIVEGPTATTINGVDAATAVIKATSDNDTPLSAYMVVIIDETRAAVVFGATPEDSAAEFMPLFETIANTIELMEPVEAVGETGGGESVAFDSQGFLLFGDVINSEVFAGESSVWDFIGLAGESIDIVIVPQEIDIVVDVVNESGSSILEFGPIDDSFDTEEILGLSIPESGTYYIVVTGFSDADEGTYELSFNEAGTATSTSGTEGLSGGDISYGETYLGSFTGEEASVAVSFVGNVGDIARVSVNPADELDIVVDFVDANGDSLLLAGSDNSFGQEAFAVQLPAAGEYAVVVSPFDEGATGDFELVLAGPTGTAVFASDAFEEADEEHAFPFTAEAGEIVSIIVEPEGELDVIVAVYDEETDENLYEIDRSFGTEGVGYIVPEDGNYYYLISGFTPDDDSDEGGENLGAYFVTLLGSERVLFELAFGDTVQGQFGGEDGFIEFTFGGATGDIVVLTLDTDEDVDGVIEILDLDDNVLAEIDDAFSGETETLSYTLESDELLIIRVSDFFAGNGLFELLVDAG